MINKIQERILTEANLREMVQLVNEEIDTANGSSRERLTAVDADLKNTVARLNRHYDALETGKLAMDELGPHIRELREQEKSLQVAKWALEALLSARKVPLVDEGSVRQSLEDLKGILNDSPLNETRAFIRSFVRETKVTGSEVLSTYTMPMAEGLVEEQLPVTSIVKDGGWYRTRTSDNMRVKHSC